MQVKDIMTTSVISATPASPVLDVARLLVDNRISAMPIVQDGKVVGIASEADLLYRYEIGTERDRAGRPWWQRLFADDDAPSNYIASHAMRVGDIMTTPVVSVAPDMSVVDLAVLFESAHIRRAPVLDGETMVGIVSRADFVRALVARAQVHRQESSMSDESIRRALLTELEAHRWWQASFTHVVVADGIVRISGLLRSSEEKIAARIAAENIPGVRGVEDDRTISTTSIAYT
ncbi:MAG: CBS domain-containing protein [Burkholderiaceae bacterium]